MRPLLPSVALVTAMFLVGCQEQGLSPVEAVDLEPQFDRPTCAGDTHCNHGDEGDDNANLISDGQMLFLTGTFGGNGRTCATCHRAASNLTIDVAFIATLNLDNDPLFVADNNSDLTDLEDGGDTGLLRTRGLILENIRGFDQNPFFRAPPSLFNLSFTAPYGLSGNIPDLRAFIVGAVEQHFPLRMRRLAGTDFQVPTEAELDALEAFMLSLQSPADGNFKLPNGSGRRAFRRVGCGSCHRGTVLSGGNFNTGVELLGSPPGKAIDTGDGAGRFQTPGLFGLRKAEFFHNNAVLGLRQAVAFYDSSEFKRSPESGRVTFDANEATKNQQIDDITAFLMAISAL